MTDLSELVETGEASPVPIPQATVEPAATTAGGLDIQRVQSMAKNFNMLIYGESGVGKTVLAGSAVELEEMGPVLFVDVEGGLLSVQAMGYDVDYIRVKTWEQMAKVYNDLYDGKLPYKTVVIDSLTEAQKFSMSRIMRDVVAQDSDRDPDIPSVREWGKNIEQTRRLVRGFRDLPINTIFTALAIEEKDTRTGLVHKRPYLSGKLSKEVAGFLDVVVYMYKKVIDDEIVRLLLTQGTEDTVAKDRFIRLPMVVQDPTMRLLYDTITGQVTHNNTGE